VVVSAPFVLGISAPVKPSPIFHPGPGSQRKTEQGLSDVAQRIVFGKLDLDDIEDRFRRARKIEQVAVGDVQRSARLAN
jgi:hypothetical protein